MNAPVLRFATLDDTEPMLAIYRPCVEHTAISFELEAPTPEAFRARVAKALDGWAWLVAFVDGRCAGYAYGSQYRERAAYRWSCETSAYVDPAFHRRGVGRALYAALLDVLAGRGFCTAYAGIALPNDASIALHRAVGFESIGVFGRAGRKFGAWHDVSWWQRRLRDVPPEGADVGSPPGT